MNVPIVVIVVVLISCSISFLTIDFDMKGLKYSWDTYKYYKLTAEMNGVKVKTARILADINHIAHIATFATLAVAVVILILAIPFGKEDVTPVGITKLEEIELIEQKSNEASFYVSRKKNTLEILYINNTGKIATEKIPIDECYFVYDTNNYVVKNEQKIKRQFRWLIFKLFSRTKTERSYEIHTTSIYDQLAGR